MSEYRWLNKESQDFLDKDYLVDQTTNERVDIVCEAAERILKKPGFAKRFKSYFQKGWYSWSTPIWCNFGNDRGLPISCFGTYVDDNMGSILQGAAEVGMMTKIGGGTSAYFGALRPKGSPIRKNGKSDGSVHFMKIFETIINIISQGSARRGTFAAYLPIDHGDFDDFVNIKHKGHSIQHIYSGIVIPEGWMESMLAGDKSKQKRWAKVLKSRATEGVPYIVFEDNANNGRPQVYKDKGLTIKGSNVCSEIMLPRDDEESFVCDLSSMNILYYDEWKDTDAVETLTYFLDAVMSEFIEKAKKVKFMERPLRFAERHRALGIGWFGWHSYLQSRMIAYESMEAKFLNTEIAQHIYEKSQAASRKMAIEYGEPEILRGYGLRNTTTCAIAPTKSSSFIIGQASEGIEPFKTNYHITDSAKQKYTFRNPYLELLLDSKGQNTYETWNAILKNGGSVQRLSFLDDHEKAVFKTFGEISPKEVVIQAAQRQKYVDQGQSLNLLIHPSVPARDVSKLLVEAWEMGIKSLYYQKSVNAAQNFAREILNCSACES